MFLTLSKLARLANLKWFDLFCPCLSDNQHTTHHHLLWRNLLSTKIHFCHKVDFWHFLTYSGYGITGQYLCFQFFPKNMDLSVLMVATKSNLLVNQYRSARGSDLGSPLPKPPQPALLGYSPSLMISTLKSLSSASSSPTYNLLMFWPRFFKFPRSGDKYKVSVSARNCRHCFSSNPLAKTKWANLWFRCS